MGEDLPVGRDGGPWSLHRGRTAAVALACLVMGACGGNRTGTTGAAAVQSWSCIEDSGGPTASCSCTEVRVGSSTGTPLEPGTRGVAACGSYTCCLATQTTSGWQCDCENLSNCAAEAQTRRNTEVVETCPPGGTVDASKCAASGENCRADYLSSQGLLGCCPGLSCAEVDGVPVCTSEPVVSATPACLPGQLQMCTCDDGSTGATTCADGIWGPCSCGGTSGSGCGNGVIGTGEECDGVNFGGETCASATMNALPSGLLLCTANCNLDTSGCRVEVTGSPACVVGTSQACTCADGSSGATYCADGTWGPCICTSSSCGNGVVELGEECDGADLGGQTCASVTMNALPLGTLSCTTSCTFDASGCAASAPAP